MTDRCAMCPYRALAHANVARTRAFSRRAASARAWRLAAATSPRADTGGDEAARRPQTQRKQAPWALMGRSVHEQHVGLSREAEDELALGAVADEAGVSLESLRANVKRLERLCPPLVTRRARGEVKPALLVRLALDLDAVTSSMMRLKILLPNADVAEMCARKLALFESDAVDRAVAVAAKVRRDFPERFGDEKNKTSTGRTTADALLASVPDILLVDSDEALGRIVLRARALRSLLPGADIAALAGKQPSFLLTDDAGRSLARGGHAAGLEVGRSYEPGVPKRPIEAVFVSIREMKKRMPPECDVDRLLTDFPNLLAMDVPALFEDVARVFPNRDPADVLRRNPKIAYQFERNTASAAPMGPAANTTQAFEENAGLMTIDALEALGAKKKRERQAPE